ncbi:TonB-dependent siderophore receptor [Candidatus Gracilibacteria bacterium]|nr:TonB-dependent siderophore receptor [Candidatus Gracilibacteria bacterium]
MLVTVTGEDKQPKVELFDSEEGLIFSAVGDTESAQEEEDIELVVTGEQDGYFVPNSSVGTRTDAPLRDIPQSIQVVPRQVIEDQGANDVGDVLSNVSGVSERGGLFFIRGFESTGSFLRDGTGTSSSFRRTDLDLSNIEQVEVLKGPASVLYGTGEPGGTINLVTEQPLRDPAYEVTARIGNFDFYRGSVDLTGPLNNDRTILYRLNFAYENAGSFVDFVERERIAIFPVLSFELGENTLLTVEGGYENESSLNDPGLPLEGTILPNPLGEVPRDRFLGEPDADRDILSEGYVGYRLEHQFSDDWSILNKFTASFSTRTQGGGVLEILGLGEDSRTVERDFARGTFENQNYTLQTDVNGEFQTGIIDHALLLGIELRRNDFSDEQFAGAGSSIDLFDPEYGDLPSSADLVQNSLVEQTTHTIGVYAQDLLSIGEQVKILLGGRFDWFFNDFVNKLSNTSEYTEEFAFSPRIGIVYQPIEPVSLYASWSRSFVPQVQVGVDREGNPFEPTRGNQFEVGVKTELFERRLTATLAAYYITRQNELVPDPVDSDFSIQLGETRSQGIEFDIAGEPLPGLRLIANYAYTDAIISEGESEFEGNRITGIPLHSGSFWVVYELQQGTLEGLGFGAGLRAIGESEGDFENSFELPSYLRTDAVLYYRQDDWRVQLNVENLFDVEYFESNNRRYGQPFTIRGTVSVEFGSKKRDRPHKPKMNRHLSESH